MYLYEPCRSLELDATTGAQKGEPKLGSARTRMQCEELIVRLLCCNATEGDLRLLLRDWRAARRSTGLVQLAVAAGALRLSPGYQGNSANGGVVQRVAAGALGAAFASKCRKSWRVVKELATRFDAPLPRAVVRSIKAAQEVSAHHSSSLETKQSPQGEEQSGNEDLCKETPNHWACRGAAVAWEATPIKVLCPLAQIYSIVQWWEVQSWVDFFDQFCSSTVRRGRNVSHTLSEYMIEK